jgi:hypothetical protein
MVGGFTIENNKDVGSMGILIGTGMFAVALIRRIIALFTRIKPKQSTPQAQPAEAQYVAPSASVVVPESAHDTKLKPDKDSFKHEGHRVAGPSYHRDEIEALGTYNVDYDMTAAEIRDSYDEWDRVYEYVFDPSGVELVPEPENEHDNNAIRVVIDGHHVGYIKHGSNAHIRKLMNENRIVEISAEIGGGKYKQLDDEGHVTKDQTEYYVKLDLKVKN